MTEPVGEPDLPDLPELGVHLLVGNDILTKAYNLHRNLDDERVSLIEAVAVKDWSGWDPVSDNDGWKVFQPILSLVCTLSTKSILLTAVCD